jgi:hypothetical protein
MKTNLWRFLTLLTVAILAVAALGMAGCSSDGGDDTPIYDGDVPDGDTSDGDTSDGDEPDGDEPDGDEPDGDTLPDGDDPDGDVVDGDEPDGDVVDGDETDGDVPTAGSIAGTVYTSEALAASDVQIMLFNSNPFEVWGAVPVAEQTITGVANNTEKAFALTDVPTGRYYMWAYIDVSNDTDASNDVFNVYPRVLTLVAQEPDLRDITGADIYIDAPNPELGSIAGTLHSSAYYQEKRITMVTSRVIEQEKAATVEYWPSSVEFIEPGAAERDYALYNLPDGAYYTFAYVPTGEETAPLAYGSPYDALEIIVAEEAKKDYADEHFYLGVADPAFGSISGTISLPTAVEGELGVYVFSSKVEEDVTSVEPLALILVKNDGVSTNFPYTIGNLGNQTDIWVAGGIQLDAEHLALGYHSESLSINLAVPAEKDLLGKNMSIPITELSGTVTVSSESDPGWARVVLADMSVNILENPMITVNDFGGGTDVPLSAPSRGTMSGDYTMFPVKGGSWSVVVVLDTDAVEGISDQDQWCFQWSDKKGLAPKITIDGTQLEITGQNISVDTSLAGGWLCSAPPASK